MKGESDALGGNGSDMMKKYNNSGDKRKDFQKVTALSNDSVELSKLHSKTMDSDSLIGALGANNRHFQTLGLKKVALPGSNYHLPKIYEVVPLTSASTDYDLGFQTCATNKDRLKYDNDRIQDILDSVYSDSDFSDTHHNEVSQNVDSPKGKDLTGSIATKFRAESNFESCKKNN